MRRQRATRCSRTPRMQTSASLSCPIGHDLPVGMGRTQQRCPICFGGLLRVGPQGVCLTMCLRPISEWHSADKMARSHRLSVSTVCRRSAAGVTVALACEAWQAQEEAIRREPQQQRQVRPPGARLREPEPQDVAGIWTRHHPRRAAPPAGPAGSGDNAAAKGGAVARLSAPRARKPARVGPWASQRRPPSMAW